MKEELIKAALLGTDKFVPDYGLSDTDLPAKISEQSENKEDVFLKQSAVAFTYSEAGLEAKEMDLKDLAFNGKIGQLLDPKIENLLRTALKNNDVVLTRFLSEKLQNVQAFVSPNLVPAVLDLALKNKTQAAGLLSLCGEVGKWLIANNNHWEKLTAPEDGDFETGTFDLRLKHLEKLRASQPTEALELLKENIAAETADKRQKFLTVLETGISSNDENFLESLLKDKSIKVRQEAVNLLQLIPNSRISNLFLDYLKSAMEVREERVMLISKKKKINLLEVEPSKELFKLGIEKISSEKGVKDHHFWIAQALAVVNPDELANALNVPVEDLFQMIFTSAKKGEYFYRFLNEAVVKFKHQIGVKELMKIRGDALLVSVLPTEERPPYFEKILPKHLSGIFQLLQSEPFTVLPESLSRKMIDALRKEPYSISANDYYGFGFYLSGEVLNLLTKEAQRDSDKPQNRFFYKNISETARGLEARIKV